MPDDARRAEGVAGVTWAENYVIPVRDLPDLRNASAAEKEEYARQTFVTVKWLAKEKPRSRSLCGIPVQVRGKKWGVLVLDSEAPGGEWITRVTNRYRGFADVVSNLLGVDHD